MVMTVGPTSISRPSITSTRSLPPTWASRSTTVTSAPRWASTAAAASPPMPAPMTTTRSPKLTRSNERSARRCVNRLFHMMDKQ
jgi:hypothetical protein